MVADGEHMVIWLSHMVGQVYQMVISFYHVVADGNHMVSRFSHMENLI